MSNKNILFLNEGNVVLKIGHIFCLVEINSYNLAIFVIFSIFDFLCLNTDRIIFFCICAKKIINHIAEFLGKSCFDLKADLA